MVQRARTLFEAHDRDPQVTDLRLPRLFRFELAGRCPAVYFLFLAQPPEFLGLCSFQRLLFFARGVRWAGGAGRLRPLFPGSERGRAHDEHRQQHSDPYRAADNHFRVHSQSLRIAAILLLA